MTCDPQVTSSAAVTEVAGETFVRTYFMVFLRPLDPPDAILRPTAMHVTIAMVDDLVPKDITQYIINKVAAIGDDMGMKAGFELALTENSEHTFGVSEPSLQAFQVLQGYVAVLLKARGFTPRARVVHVSWC